MLKNPGCLGQKGQRWGWGSRWEPDLKGYGHQANQGGHNGRQRESHWNFLSRGLIWDFILVSMVYTVHMEKPLKGKTPAHGPQIQFLWVAKKGFFNNQVEDCFMRNGTNGIENFRTKTMRCLGKVMKSQCSLLYLTPLVPHQIRSWRCSELVRFNRCKGNGLITLSVATPRHCFWRLKVTLKSLTLMCEPKVLK